MEPQLDELLERWCRSGPVSLSGPRVVSFRVDDDAFNVEVRSINDDEAELRARWTAPAGLTELDQLTRATLLMRSGLLRCEQVDDGLDIVLPLYLEGLSRQDFLNAVTELGRAHWVLDDSARALETQREVIEKTQRTLAEMEASREESERALRELEQPAPPEGVAARGGVVAAWTPGVIVADGGAPAWGAPDPSAAPVTTLTAGVELHVQERRGDWAHVIASNGWSGWVDGRRLVTR